MKYILLIAATLLGGCKRPLIVYADPQVAAGEWKIQVQTPPCTSKNIQIIYPTDSGAPITIECNLMPVAEK